MAATGGAGLMMASLSARATRRATIKAIAFDAFPIFDPRSIFALSEQLFPGRGAELATVWRTRQFEYQWLRTLSGRYADFWQTTEDALIYSAELLKLNLTVEQREQLMNAYLALKTWPDVLAALKVLERANIRLAFLSNATPQILNAGIQNSALHGIFEHVLSTHTIRTYKPDPRAYQMAMEAFQLNREEILFVAFAGWDAAGAKSFGYTTFWVNRLNLPPERLGFLPDAIGQNLADLVSYVKTGGAHSRHVLPALLAREAT